MTGSALVLRGDARRIPLPDNSVDLIVTSPPYFALRSYRDAGEHYDGQIGSEPTPQDFIDALVECTAEMVRVVKPEGSIFVDLGDKYAGSGGNNQSGLSPAAQRAAEAATTYRDGPRGYNQNSGGIRAKSLMLLPERYRIACVDELGLIAREVIVWNKPNGLPESVRDRARRSHEDWVHLVKSPRYFAAVDEIREPHSAGSLKRSQPHRADPGRAMREGRPVDGTGMPPHSLDLEHMNHPLGKLPGSVWEIPSEPLTVPEYAIEDDRGWRMFGRICSREKDRRAVRKALWEYAQQQFREGCRSLRIWEPDHFAAFPQEWPRRLILGWSPSGICEECWQGRFPVVDRQLSEQRKNRGQKAGRQLPGDENGHGMAGAGAPSGRTEASILGYACACTPYTDRKGTGETSPTADESGRQGDRPVDIGATHRRVGPWREYHLEEWTPPEIRPAVILDPFGGTGTTAMVARALGRVGISIDLSLDYCRLARWRIFESGHARKAIAKTARERQGSML